MKKLNLLDYMIILVIILAAAGGYLYVNAQKADGDEISVLYTIELRGVPEEFLETPKIGDDVFDSIKGFSIGVIVDMYHTPTTTFIWDYDKAAFNLVDVPNEYNLYVTVSSEGLETNLLITAGEVEVRVGKMMYIKGKGYASQGVIVDMQTEKKGA